ncbi:MAG: MG2 domain-containing protein [Kofleriaceae bacterium]|nr:MG2 domain-containing protein [Kofleriaceae bacterium]
MNRSLGVLLVFTGAFVVAYPNTHDGRCEAAYLDYGLTMKVCPSGKTRQTARLELANARRGAESLATLTATAHFTVGAADAGETLPLEVRAATLSLVDAAGKPTPIQVTKWKGRTAIFTLPEVPDGDYKLHATFETRVGPGELDVAVPLYTPARIHVITDRPLYEPGNTVRFRAVALRARDLSPLDGRPGMWIVKDPNGEVLLEERAPAMDWGVVAGSFPIDRLAQTGSWTVAWKSGDATDEVAFKVEPFKLPRFRVEASADRTVYGAGDKPTIKGAVIYSSGAPVANAKIEIAWDVSGAWPPPTEWQETVLPKQVVTGGNGRFELALPEIPADLQGRATLTAHLAAIDAAGDRVEGSASVLLSQDGIQASSVTELGDGLVEGFNNRMYVRVTTPDGQVVRNTKVTLKRSWQPNDPGLEAELDEDGVASVQIDPGAPVNIVIPALPFRPQKKAPVVERDEIEELISDEGASLADQVEVDKWLAPLATCAKWAGADAVDANGEEDGESGGNEVRVGLRVNANGAIALVGAGATPLAQCVAGVIRPRRLPAGKERVYTIGFRFEDPELPTLVKNVRATFDSGPEGLDAALEQLARSTRDCLPQVDGDLAKALAWRVRAGSKDVELGPWVTVPGDAEAASALACVQSRFGTRVMLREPAPNDELGLVKFSVTLPESVAQARPQPTTMLGYELTVSVQLEGKEASTKLRVAPGAVPPLRLRVNPILAKVGDTITAELIRGPAFTGTLPKTLELRHLKGKPVEAKLDAERRATFTVEKGTEGWVEILGAGQRALVYVKPETDLTVSVEAKQPRYKPGDQVELAVQTKIGGQGSKAAVGLFGVDDSLGQIATLAQPDSMARVQPKVETSSPAFGTLDGQALTLGRIRGVNAAAATVLRVSTVPAAPALDAVVHAAGGTHFDPVEELTDNFYTVLGELHVQARAWERSAPPAEKMRPKVMAQLWAQALAACKARGEKVVDAYGRELRLSMLPSDLLALTDPRAVIVLGTRLPEDVENWSEWISKEKP